MRRLFFVFIVLILGCDTGELKLVMDLPGALHEVSGLVFDQANGLYWMVNDSGNKPILYGVNEKGAIVKSIKINAKNRDWEDLTSDNEGNIYIGDFGNNKNDRKKLSVLKIKKEHLDMDSVTPELITFNYPQQKKYPPKKDNRHFDCEAFFFLNNSLYLFTKSRSSTAPEKTNLYRLPTSPGDYEAEYLQSFNTCKEDDCQITSADVTKKGDAFVLLTNNSVFVFSELNNANLLDSPFKRYQFTYKSQKESVVFKNDSTLYIADEYAKNEGGNMYEFVIK